MLTRADKVLLVSFCNFNGMHSTSDRSNKCPRNRNVCINFRIEQSNAHSEEWAHRQNPNFPLWKHSTKRAQILFHLLKFSLCIHFVNANREQIFGEFKCCFLSSENYDRSALSVRQQSGTCSLAICFFFQLLKNSRNYAVRNRCYCSVGWLDEQVLQLQRQAAGIAAI